MPAPVSFNLSLAPLPINFQGTPQQWATAVVDRLTITPTAPWSSFLNGGSIPSSDNGPVLYGGVNGPEWRVWNGSLGAYQVLNVNGNGLIANTVQLGAIATQDANALLGTNSSGAVTVIDPSTNGYLMTMVSGAPAWASPANPPGAAFFIGTMSASQTLTTNNSSTTIQFNQAGLSQLTTYVPASYGFTIPAGDVWVCSVTLQIENATGTGTNFQASPSVCLNGVPVAGTVFKTAPYVNRVGFAFTAVVVNLGSNAGLVSVNMICTEDTPSSNWTIANNSGNTVFSGWKIGTVL
jgi:hypothetical protein